MGVSSSIWFVDTRVQTSNLKRWFMYGILLFVFVGVFTVLGVKSMYKPIKKYEIHSDNPQIAVDEAKGTVSNGYIKGSVFNKGEAELKGKYIKFIFYNEKNAEVGKEYIEIGNLESQQTKTYDAKFKYPNVESFVVTISDNKE